MYTAIILMCTADMWCYNLVYENAFLQSHQECEAAIQELIRSEDFDPIYRFYEQGVTYNVHNSTCINWEEKDI